MTYIDHRRLFLRHIARMLTLANKDSALIKGISASFLHYVSAIEDMTYFFFVSTDAAQHS
ncbi:hypothetical protein SAMN05421848_3177 [Kushneria avicenniae]|uniref:Uncharacterized protein n=1 Tax=Kushneria avicenniae TaxID=402385 RepID=A0A1I1MVX3_9GAMM|nr:hypothetical protein SAMN05421848_3177 [Kushneria avicenniae]